MDLDPDHVIGTTISHSDFGDPDCCGCLNGIICGEQAHIECNECATVIRTLRAADLQQILTEMELTLELAGALCPHCGAANLFPGFSRIMAFTCKECEKGVGVYPDGTAAMRGVFEIEVQIHRANAPPTKPHAAYFEFAKRFPN